MKPKSEPLLNIKAIFIILRLQALSGVISEGQMYNVGQEPKPN